MKIGLDELNREVRELFEKYPKLSADNRFCLWFVNAYISDDIESAAKSITGSPNDKDADAVFIDNVSNSVFIIQSKFRNELQRKIEKREDINSLALMASYLSAENESFTSYINTCDAIVARKLKEARKKLKNRNYRLFLFYVTTGRASRNHVEDAVSVVRRTSKGASFNFIDGNHVIRILQDYLDGVAPPIPEIILNLEKNPSIENKSILNRFDTVKNINSWVVTANCKELADIYKLAGKRLFARNIRGYLGETSINEAMLKTLRNDPGSFYYYNNGVTVICDSAEEVNKEGKQCLYVSNPQIINGQQTTRTVAAHPELAKKASVMIKVISLARSDNIAEFDELVNKVVSGTNWQNKIGVADLRSNERKQIELERALRKHNYHYMRKKETKREMKSSLYGRHFYLIKKEELAQAVAGCLLDPTVARSGKDNLFKDPVYKKVFPNTDVDFYLPKYWMMKIVTRLSKGKPERGYSKWMVLKFLWGEIDSVLNTKSAKVSFRKACEMNYEKIIKPLEGSADKAFIAAIKFYRQNRGRGQEAIDISHFFRYEKQRDEQFKKYWNSRKNRSKRGFNDKWIKFKNELVLFQER